jgi:hypothetical protein
VNPIGKEVCDELEIKFYEADWKKKEGFKQSLDTCRELSIYRQHYCGCKYSLKEHEERLAQKAAQEVVRIIEAGAGKQSEAAPKRVTKAMRILAEKPPAEAPASVKPADTRAKWELSPLERKLRRDKKTKPWQRE